MLNSEVGHPLCVMATHVDRIHFTVALGYRTSPNSQRYFYSRSLVGSGQTPRNWLWYKGLVKGHQGRV